MRLLCIATLLCASAYADDYIPSRFHGGWASEDSSLQAIIVREDSVRLFYESGQRATCVPKQVEHYRPGLFRSAHAAQVQCVGVDMARLAGHNALFKSRWRPDEVRWSVYFSEVELGYEIEVMSCLSPIDDKACPKAVMYRAE